MAEDWQDKWQTVSLPPLWGVNLIHSVRHGTQLFQGNNHSIVPIGTHSTISQSFRLAHNNYYVNHAQDPVASQQLTGSCFDNRGRNGASLTAWQGIKAVLYSIVDTLTAWPWGNPLSLRGNHRGGGGVFLGTTP